MNFTVENNILKSTEKFFGLNRNLGQLIYNVLSESPEHVSQIDAATGKQITYTEMKERSTSCALWMTEQGIGPKDIVVICAGYQVDSYVPLLATFFLDAVYAGWNQDISLSAARHFIKEHDPKIIFTCKKAAKIILEASTLESSNVKLVVFEKFSNLQTLNDTLINYQKTAIVNNFKPINKKSSEELVAIILSSRSTGYRKGVMISSKALLSVSLHQTFLSTLTLKILYYSPLDWISGLYFMLHTILMKYTRIVPLHCSIDNCFETIEKYEVDYLAIPPNFVNTLAKSDEIKQNYNLKSLKFMFTAGCKIGKRSIGALRQKFPNATIKRIYGMTETLRLFETNDKTESVESAGHIFTNCQVKFVDLTTHESVGPNQHGEIRVKTPAIMIGYYKNAQATKEAFDTEGWFRTGDIGYYNNSGEVFILGRIDDLIIHKGRQILCAELEDVILSHPAVREAAVIGIRHEVDGDWPTAFVEKKLDIQITEQELLKYTSSILEDFKRLRGGIYFVCKLPRIGSGKIARCKLRQDAENLMKGRDNLCKSID